VPSSSFRRFDSSRDEAVIIECVCSGRSWRAKTLA